MKCLVSLALPADNLNAGDCFPSVDLSSCTKVQEIKFFVGMIPAVTFPFHGIRETLASVSSRRVQKIVMDFNIDKVDAFDKGFSQGFGGFDVQLTRIASIHRGNGKTVVKLSAGDPFVLGSYLSDFRTCGVLVLGTRNGGPLGCGGIQWYDGDGGR